MAESSDAQGKKPDNDPESKPRRNFFYEIASIVAGAAVGLAPVLAGLFSFLDPLTRKPEVPEKYRREDDDAKEGYIKVCALGALTVGGTPQRFPVIDDQIDAWNFTPNQAIGSVYIQRFGEKDLRVFNTTCPHAGCSVSCDGTAFNCPCHNSAFDLDGSKLVSDSGRENPSPRALDTLEIDSEKLADGEIWVEFKNFYTGRDEKIAKS
jgi:Rieske Fe-S protein